MTAGYHYTPLGYCDETDLENYLMMDIDDSFSPQISDWIATAEQQINKFLGYTTASGILREQITGEVIDGRVSSDFDLVIFPGKVPVVSVESVTLFKGTTELSLSLLDGSDTRYNISPNSDYVLFPESELDLTGTMLIHSFADLKYQKFFVKMNYTAGFLTVPADIRQACVNITADMIMRHANKEGLESITQGRVTKRWATRGGESDFVQDAYKLLRPYRIASRWL